MHVYLVLFTCVTMIGAVENLCDDPSGTTAVAVVLTTIAFAFAVRLL